MLNKSEGNKFEAVGGVKELLALRYHWRGECKTKYQLQRTKAATSFCMDHFGKPPFGNYILHIILHATRTHFEADIDKIILHFHGFVFEMYVYAFQYHRHCFHWLKCQGLSHTMMVQKWQQLSQFLFVSHNMEHLTIINVWTTTVWIHQNV